MQDKYIVNTDISVKNVIEKMEKNLIKAVVIVNDDNKVEGLFSNGDMRRFFLSGGNLSANISDAMNKNPRLYHSEDEVKEERKIQNRVIYPIIDNEGHLVDVLDFDNADSNGYINDSLANVPLVIMAGGKGTRLYPYTKILPKPLIPIGDYTITERIIESFRKYGCQNVKMILNYRSNMIKAYMSDLEKDYEIEFYDEDEFLGTAGGLRLLKDKINSTFFLSNCDILVNADLECIYKTHKMKGNKITFVCSMKDVVIPYGVVETDEDGMITEMQEKPGFSYLINTGLYMIEPEVINDIKEGEFIHLPELAQRYLDQGQKVGVFPISEKAWMDMGQFNEMEKMMKNLGI
ncbi:MAG: CBS domain-containing protein [Lachnospiraceae bacterium]|jgi:dTDP-glucose pyrophosphorylase|nr:CBS domain-containing protein [Lachnospiraceae bacterium]